MHGQWRGIERRSRGAGPVPARGVTAPARALPTFSLLAAALLLAARHAHAQVASAVDVGVRRWERGAAVPAVTPTLTFDARRLSAEVGGSLARGDGSPRLREANAVAALHSPAWRGLRAALATSAERGAFDATAGAAQLRAEARLAFERGPVGAWVSGARSRAWTADHTPGVLHTGAGAWARVRSVVVQASLTHRAIQGWTVAGRDSTGVSPETCRGRAGYAECVRRLSVTDVAAAAAWSGRRVDLAATSGVRVAGPRLDRSRGRAWGAASAALWISPTVALAAGLDALPTDPVRQLPARRVAQAGLRLRAAPRPRGDLTLPPAPDAAPVPAPLTVGPERGGVRTLRVAAPGAASVEVMGDCTGWRPVPLAPQPDGSWATALPLAAGGVYHLQLRVDGGEWRPPPGLPTVPDGFAGTVGVLVVQPDR